ncbi:MAG: hypothetical protein GXZ06_01825 [Tissierellia bacterium]|nr:hypothetical protein [Tissierellia bacterium]
MLIYIQKVLIALFTVSVIGYIFTVLKQKVYLKNNIIVIENKAVSQEDLDKADMKEFVFKGKAVKSGDEVRVITNKNDKYEGTLIGISRKEKALLMVTYKDEIKELKIDNIEKFKIICKYGQFFN